MSGIRKPRYQTYRDEVQGRDDGGNDIVVSVPDKVVTDVPDPGVRFTILEAPADQAPKGGHYDGPPANLHVTVDDTSVQQDSGG